MVLTTKFVEEVFKECSYDYGTWEPDCIVPIQGIRGASLLDKRKIPQNIDDIANIRLALYPDAEEKAIPFRNLCDDLLGNQWGEHRDMERACVLMIAAGFGNWVPLHKKDWPASLPDFFFYALNKDVGNG